MLQGLATRARARNRCQPLSGSGAAGFQHQYGGDLRAHPRHSLGRRHPGRPPGRGRQHGRYAPAPAGLRQTSIWGRGQRHCGAPLGVTPSVLEHHLGSSQEPEWLLRPEPGCRLFSTACTNHEEGCSARPSRRGLHRLTAADHPLAAIHRTLARSRKSLSMVCSLARRSLAVARMMLLAIGSCMAAAA